MEMRDTLTYRMEAELGAWFYDCVKHDFVLNPDRNLADRSGWARLLDDYEKRLRIVRSMWLDPDRSPKMEGMLAELHPPEKKES